MNRTEQEKDEIGLLAQAIGRMQTSLANGSESMELIPTSHFRLFI